MSDTNKNQDIDRGEKIEAMSAAAAAEPSPSSTASSSSPPPPAAATAASAHDVEKVPVDEHPNGGDVPPMQQLTVEELYDKDKYDLSTMEPGDVFVLLQ